jgi:hypothetical protein
MCLQASIPNELRRSSFVTAALLAPQSVVVVVNLFRINHACFPGQSISCCCCCGVGICHQPRKVVEHMLAEYQCPVDASGVKSALTKNIK